MCREKRTASPGLAWLEAAVLTQLLLIHYKRRALPGHLCVLHLMCVLLLSFPGFQTQHTLLGLRRGYRKEMLGPELLKSSLASGKSLSALRWALEDKSHLLLQTTTESETQTSKRKPRYLLFSGLSWGVLVHLSPEQNRLGLFLLSKGMLVFRCLPVTFSRSGD